ncbi:hypothetical protein PV10_08115 [Exophiala mesophila]|uniref:Trafficking protein particle complex II-specific subunit 65 IgD3 domain-containing protein n=1 Tax=Exophiala mesophila TaxID=212818 RepID=A0A0D1WHY8_EXOME|nr:uncharacterized protein PV10_08115 [Exophiala mesophila]KIV88430.1 hypothetical protein PV10_08115 [Exophiala mesophila]
MDTDFFRAAVLDVIVPEDTTAELATILEDGADNVEEPNRLLPIKERDYLFFDERLRTLAVLQVPYCDEDALKAYLARVALKVDVWAFDESGANDPSIALNSPSREHVISADGFQGHEPIVLASQSADLGKTLTLVWEVGLTLSRPRSRNAQQSLVLIPSGVVNSPQYDEDDPNRDLAPFQPLEANVLEPMRSMAGPGANAPYLAVSRLERVLPVAQSHRHRAHIGHVHPRRWKAVPAAIARVRYNKSHTHTVVPTNIALLDMEIIPFVQVEAKVEQVDVSLKNGESQSLMPGFLPMQCRSGDCLTFMYQLQQVTHATSYTNLGLMNPNIDLLSIKIVLRIMVSATCTPVVTMEWTTHVDFTQALNPSYGAPSQPIQRSNRPSSLPVNGLITQPPVTAVSASLQPVYPPLFRSGLSVTFLSSNEPATIGRPFTWKVLLVNQSQGVARIAIIPLPRLQRQTSQAQTLTKRHAPKSSTASFHPSERRHTRNGDDVDIAQAIVDENVLYVMQHSNSVPPEADLMALTSELRIGPLAPGQCHESEIQMVAFETGTLTADVIRIVDLIKEGEDGVGAPGVVADIRDLPNVVVVEESDG